MVQYPLQINLCCDQIFLQNIKSQSKEHSETQHFVNLDIDVILFISNFSYSQCSEMNCMYMYIVKCILYFVKLKHFQYVKCGMKKIYVVCRQNCSRICLSGVSWDLIFINSSLKLLGKCTILYMNFITSLCGHC